MVRKLRATLLSATGRSWVARAYWGWRYSRNGIEVRRAGRNVEFHKGHAAIRVAPKHAFFAPVISHSFESFTRAMQPRQENGFAVTDFSEQMDLFNVCRNCLPVGGVIENHDGAHWLRKGDRAMVLAPRHLIYAPYLAEHFDMYFSPLKPKVVDRVCVLDFSRPGNLQTYKSGLEFEMASFPEEEEAIEAYFEWYTPKKGDVIFDIGAHCGVSTYHFSHRVGPEGKVICFEPDPGNFELLQRNIQRHGLTNVHCEQAAITGEGGEVMFSAEGTIGSMMASLLMRESAGKVVAVKAWTLAEAYAKFGVPDLCKIDIEGAEIDVIAKARKTLREHKTNLVLDTSHLKANGTPTAPEVDAMLRQYGYDVKTEEKPMLTTWARPPQ